MGSLKKKKSFVTEVSEHGNWKENPNESWIGKMAEEFKGQKVRFSCEPYIAPKSTGQLGYFYGVVLPWYMFGLIQSGTENLQIDNEVDEKLVEEYLKEKHLKNGDPWKAMKIENVVGPKFTDLLVVKTVHDGGFVEKDDPIVVFRKNHESDMVWKAPFTGELDMMIGEGELLEPSQVIGVIKTLREIPGKPSLAKANWKEAKNFIDRVIREANLLFGIKVPPADPEYQRREKGEPTLRDELNMKLKGQKIVRCARCEKKIPLSEVQEEEDAVLCIECMFTK